MRALAHHPITILRGLGRLSFLPILFISASALCGCEDKAVRAAREQLLAGAEQGNVEQVKKAMAEGADITWTDKSGTALHRAAWNGHVPVVRLLLERGAAVNAEIPVSVLDVFNKAYTGALDEAVKPIREDSGFLGILSPTIAGRIRGAFGATALHFAAFKGNKELVALLIASGANVDKKLTIGPDWKPQFVKTMMEVAEAGGNQEVIQLLSDKASKK